MTHELIICIIPLVLIGAATGALGAMLGIGGGLIYVPVAAKLLDMAGVPADLAFKSALGTSLFTMFFTSLAAAYGHYKNRNFIPRASFWLIIGCVVGAQFGARAAILIAGGNLKLIFACFMLVISGRMLWGKKDSVGDVSPTEASNNRALFAAVGLCAGFIGSLLGVGGGIILVPGLFILMRHDFKQVVGSSSLVIVFNSLSGFLHYMAVSPAHALPFSAGYVNWLIAACLVPGGIIGAFAGVRIVRKMRRRPLEIAFAALVVTIALEFFGVYDAVAGLLK